MSGLQALAEKVVERAAPGESVEAFLTHGREFTVRAFEGEVDSLSSAEPRGAGVRVIVEGRAGFSYSTDLSEQGLAEVLEQARGNARHATPDEAVALAQAWREPPSDVDGLVDGEQSQVSPDEKVALALELERSARGGDPRVRVVEDAVYADAEVEVALANSNGVSGSYRSTDAWCYVTPIATDDDDTQIGFEFDLARGSKGLDVARTAAIAVARAVGVLGAKKIPSARMPVVFDAYTAGQFLGVIAGVLTGEAVQKGRSLFAGKLGQEVAARDLTLWDDGTIPAAPGSSPWDDEGVPRRRTNIIENGVLTSYLYDVVSARRDGTESTGNAARAGFKSAPGPSPSNLSFDGTGETRAVLLQRAGRAFLVEDLHGVHSGADPISGDFSVGATGHLLEDGAPAQAVKEVTIAAPMLEILAGIRGIADDRRWLPFGGSLGGATTLIEEMTVAGE